MIMVTGSKGVQNLADTSIEKKLDILIQIFLGWTFAVVCFFDYHLGVKLGANVVFSEMILLAIFLATVLWALHAGRIQKDLFILVSSVILLSAVGVIKYHPFWSVVGSVFLLKAYFAYVLGTVIFRRDKYILRILHLIIFLGVLTALKSIVEMVVDMGWLNDLLGIFAARTGAIGIFDNANKNAQFLLFAGLAVLLVPKTRISRKWYLTLFIIAIFLSGSRQALLAMGLFVTCAVLFYPDISKKTKLFILLGGGFLVLLLALFLGGVLFSRFSEVSRVIEGGEYFRLKALLICLHVFMENPVTGLGPGSFGGAVANISNSPFHDKYDLFAHWIGYESRPTTIDMFWPHYLAETGLLGIAIYSNFIIRIVSKLFNIAKSNAKAIYLVAFLFAVLFMGLFSFILESNFVGLVFFALCGGWIHNQCLKEQKY